MSKVRTYPIFVGVDRLGLPLEVAIDTAVKRGWTVNAALLDFVLGASQAGWTLTKVRSDVREFLGLTLLTPSPYWRQWSLPNSAKR